MSCPCSIDNNIDRDFLFLSYPPVEASVTITSSAGPYLLGAEVDLECAVSGGSPAPALKWFKGSAEVSIESVLSFPAAVDDHDKVFRCDAVNNAGTVSAAITLQVYCKYRNPAKRSSFAYASLLNQMRKCLVVLVPCQNELC